MPAGRAYAGHVAYSDRLVDQHVDAVRAITREYARPDLLDVARAVDQAAARGHGRIPDRGKSVPAGLSGKYPGAFAGAGLLTSRSR